MYHGGGDVHKIIVVSQLKHLTCNACDMSTDLVTFVLFYRAILTVLCAFHPLHMYKNKDHI